MSVKVAQMLSKPLAEDIIAWSYGPARAFHLQIKLSVSHKTLSSSILPTSPTSSAARSPSAHAVFPSSTPSRRPRPLPSSTTMGS
ncbi:MAG: hypothetical protein ACLTKG_06765 [Collinsella intestinalis]